METGRGTASIEYAPEYALYALPGSAEEEFLLSTVFVPAGLQNLTGMLIARSDPGHYGSFACTSSPSRTECRAPGRSRR